MSKYRNTTEIKLELKQTFDALQRTLLNTLWGTYERAIDEAYSLGYKNGRNIEGFMALLSYLGRFQKRIRPKITPEATPPYIVGEDCFGLEETSWSTYTGSRSSIEAMEVPVATQLVEAVERGELEARWVVRYESTGELPPGWFGTPAVRKNDE